jgi:phosphoserine phosphatase
MQKSKIREVARALRARGAKRILFTDIDGTVYQWQLLIVLVLIIAKYYPEKRPIVLPLRKAISGYKNRVLNFSVVINILITIIPDVFRGVDKKRVKRMAAARALRVGSQVYLFPKTLIDVALAIVDEPWLIVAITGSPQEVADPFCKQLGIHVTIGSHYKSDQNGIYTGVRDIDSGINKGAILDAIADLCPEIEWDACIALGDSENDYSMFERCGFSLAINPNLPLIELIRSNENRVIRVSDGQKQGIELEAVNSRGAFAECCVFCALPPDLAEVFPFLPGMLDPANCNCKHTAS